MENENKFISLSYELYISQNGEEPQFFEAAPKEKPFEFVSGLNYTLDLFEKNVAKLEKGASFEFTIPAAQGYGLYDKENVLELDKGIFMRNGKFDSEHVKEGQIIPLSDGTQTFNALVTQILEEKVVVDLNHPLAGDDLTFKGVILENREATVEEVAEFAKQLSGGCGCGCDSCDCGCEHDHGCGDHDHGCGCGCH